eukprot:gene21516-28500_t
MSFVGGKLKLKGGACLKTDSAKKKKKKNSSKTLAALVSVEPPEDGEGEAVELDPSAKIRALLHGKELQSSEVDDKRTQAERKEEERLRKLAGKSHKDRVNEFNEYLGSLSEHHDIPKVGPG